MTSREIAGYRMGNQRIIGGVPVKAAGQRVASAALVKVAGAPGATSTPVGLVSWLGCIQAQDFAMAKWAIGLRTGNVTEAEIDRDFNEGKILRTHILRPTWHFVSPSDIGWMLRLTAPRIKAFSKGLHRKLGIDEAILRRSKTILVKALAGGKQLTREQLVQLLKKGRINTDDIRTTFLLMDAELDGVICSGGRQGKQFTYALLEERVPGLVYLEEDDAIGELAHRYFASRGPATLQDFCWWSGLNLSRAKRGVELNNPRLACVVVNGQAYWFSAAGKNPIQTIVNPIQDPKQTLVHLLPAFDEFTVAYKDRSDILPSHYHQQTGNGIFKPVIVINGQIAGTWKRSILKDKVLVETEPFKTPGRNTQRLIREAAGQYARFVGKELG